MPTFTRALHVALTVTDMRISAAWLTITPHRAAARPAG
jgi:hypothetical protein